MRAEAGPASRAGRSSPGVHKAVRCDVHTNTIEGFFGLFKRGMRGIYQHCRERHLSRYLAEFEFRYNYRVALGVDDTARTFAVLQSAGGKRLMYQDSFWAAA